MKAAVVAALALALGVALTGCTNLRARSLPAKPVLQNPCAVPPPCGPVAGPVGPVGPGRTIEK